MAKKSAIVKNIRREKTAKKYADKRHKLIAIMKSATSSPEEKFKAQAKLDNFPADAYSTRPRNRCGITGRPRGYYSKFNMSRIAVRDNAAKGYLPGMVKSSW